MLNNRGSKFGVMTGVLRSPQARSGPGPLDATSRSGQHATCRLRRALRAWGVLLVLTVLALEAVGCQNWFRPVEWPELGAKGEPKSPYRVAPKKSMGTASLTPDDIVRIMQRVGFPDEQILELGTDLHNALRLSGAAEIFYHKDKLAIFVIDHDLVRIRSRSGSFDYEVVNHRFALPALTDE